MKDRSLKIWQNRNWKTKLSAITLISVLFRITNVIAYIELPYQKVRKLRQFAIAWPIGAAILVIALPLGVQYPLTSSSTQILGNLFGVSVYYLCVLQILSTITQKLKTTIT